MFENNLLPTSSMTKEWAPSLAFRRFQSKQYELNRLYWTQVISHEALGQILEMKDKTTQTLDALNMDIPAIRHFHTVEETKQHELDELKSIGNLPEKERLWEFIHQNYGLKGLKRREKANIEAELY